jgi:hypothetical protein
MNIFLEITSRLDGAYAAQLLHRRFQQLGDIFLDLFANARLPQGSQQIRPLNVGEPAAQRALYNVIIHHGHPRCSGNRQRAVPLGTLAFAYSLEAGSGFGTVTSVAGDCDWDHEGLAKNAQSQDDERKEYYVNHEVGVSLWATD